MNEKRIETTESPLLHLPKCPGKLTITGWPGTAVIARGLDVIPDASAPNRFTVTGEGEGALRVPIQTSLKIGAAAGPLTIKHVEGGIQVNVAESSLTLNDVGPVQVETAAAGVNGENLNGLLHLSEAKKDVNLRNAADIEIGRLQGNLVVRYANGAITLGQIQGDLTLHTVNGDIHLNACTGSARLGNLGGRNQVTGVAGEIRLLGGLVNGDHLFQGDGDIIVAWPADAPVTLLATAARIDNRLPHLMSAIASTADDLTTLTGNIENGKAFLTLKTAGRIELKGLTPPGQTNLAEERLDLTPPAPTLKDLVHTAVYRSLTQVDQAEIERVAAAIYNRLESQVAEWREKPANSLRLAAKKRSVRHAQEEAEKAVRQTSPLKIPSRDFRQPHPEEARPSQEQILRLLQEDRITLKQANLLLDALKESER